MTKKGRQESFSFDEREGSTPSLYYFETGLASRGYSLVCGLDEAGRGPLAGPVVAACVILPPGLEIPGVDDSKKLTEKKRDNLCREICGKAHDFGVGIVGPAEIDRVNILEATKLAMIAAIDDLKARPDYLLIDAVSLAIDIPQNALIKGDSRSASIAAASIIAKTTRDRIMRGYHEKYPVYGFDGHKGYGAKSHMDAIKEHGPCPIHRRSFRGVLPG